MAAAEQTPAGGWTPRCRPGWRRPRCWTASGGGDRRRRAAGRAVRAAPDHVRRLHRLRPVAGLHRGLHPRGCCPGTPTPTPRAPDRPATTRLREDARRIIRDAVGGTDEDLVIFRGSGATAAVNKLVGILELRTRPGGGPAGRTAGHAPSCSSARTSITPTSCPGASRSPTRGHRRGRRRPHRPGRPGPATGPVPQRPLLIGSFSAASNVTGILTDADAVAALLHTHGALSFWDYAAAGPYVPIRVADPARAPGPQGRGVPVPAQVRRRPADPRRPRRAPRPGPQRRADRARRRHGGVRRPHGHRYLDDPVAREEGGTPAIVESIRAGLVFALKQAVGTDLIPAARSGCGGTRRSAGTPIPASRSSATPGPRLPVISFRIRHGGRYLHHNFVVALLNDLFGIQARGGCSCAGPYGHRLLAIGPARSHALRDEIVHGCDGIKPGWTRVNFNYFISEATAGYIAPRSS